MPVPQAPRDIDGFHMNVGPSQFPIDYLVSHWVMFVLIAVVSLLLVFLVIRRLGRNLSKIVIISVSSFVGLILGFLSYSLVARLLGNDHYQITEKLISAAVGLFISILAAVTTGNFLERRSKK